MGKVIHLEPDFTERPFVIECPLCGGEYAEATDLHSARFAARHLIEEEDLKALHVRARHSGRVEVVER